PSPNIYTRSLHDALPISQRSARTRSGSKEDIDAGAAGPFSEVSMKNRTRPRREASVELNPHFVVLPEIVIDVGGKPPKRNKKRSDRKSTRLNSSHVSISY